MTTGEQGDRFFVGATITIIRILPFTVARLLFLCTFYRIEQFQNYTECTFESTQDH